MSARRLLLSAILAAAPLCLAQAPQDPPEGQPEAVVDLTTAQGVQLVGGQWRYSDTRLVETEFQGQKKMVNKVKLVFESEQKTEDGKNCVVSKNFTASLHPKAKLAEFLGKWRGRPVMPGETIDLAKLLGACCTLVISHQQNLAGKT